MVTWIQKFNHECDSFCDCSDDEREDRKRVKVSANKLKHMDDNWPMIELVEKMEEFINELGDLVSCFYFEEKKARQRYFVWKRTKRPDRNVRYDIDDLHNLLRNLDDDEEYDPHSVMKSTFHHIARSRNELKEYLSNLLQELEQPSSSGEGGEGGSSQQAAAAGSVPTCQ